jgi:hypothetical protein
MYYISIDAQENELSDGAKIIKKLEKIISLGKRWELSHQPIKMLLFVLEHGLKIKKIRRIVSFNGKKVARTLHNEEY